MSMIIDVDMDMGGFGGGAHLKPLRSTMTKQVSTVRPAARLAAGRISRVRDSQLTTTVCQCRSGDTCLYSSGMFMPPKKCTFRGRPVCEDGKMGRRSAEQRGLMWFCGLQTAD